MPTMRKKSDLPVKTCPICKRTFAWRKKWRKDWDNVIYCSEKCRRNSHTPKPIKGTSTK
ncbi:MAG: DUF2256 domain-containing protein [Chloroflexota bacterium]